MVQKPQLLPSPVPALEPAARTPGGDFWNRKRLLVPLLSALVGAVLGIGVKSLYEQTRLSTPSPYVSIEAVEVFSAVLTPPDPNNVIPPARIDRVRSPIPGVDRRSRTRPSCSAGPP